MRFKQSPELQVFLAFFAETDVQEDSQTTENFLASVSSDKRQQTVQQAKNWMAQATFLEDLGMIANRWFGDEGEAREWMNARLTSLENASSDSEDSVVVKDSNGTPLQDGDSVTVIKDLKVKGGSSDLKRGTMIKKIRLVGDPDVIECNVDGSTLVLKTCFLKKA